MERVTLWQTKRDPVAKAAIGTKAQATRIVEGLRARALELYGPPVEKALERLFDKAPDTRSTYADAMKFLSDHPKDEKRMSKSLEQIDATDKAFRQLPLDEQLASVFKANQPLYQSYIEKVTGDRRSLVANIEKAFDAAVAPVTALFERQGAAPIDALSKSYEFTPGAYGLRRHWCAEAGCRPADVIGRAFAEAVAEVHKNALRLVADVAARIEKGEAAGSLEETIDGITHPLFRTW